ncbi:unnamed protein product [Rhizopus stolonifer]
MHIKNARSALITNYEVLQLLEESQVMQKQIQKDDPSVEYPESLRTVQFELTEYLKQTPVSTQAPEQIADFMKAMSVYDLTKAEKLQLLNLRPKSAVEIYLVIEEYDDEVMEEEEGGEEEGEEEEGGEEEGGEEEGGEEEGGEEEGEEEEE